MKIILDFETTGLSELENDIIEIGAIKVDENLNKVSTFHTFIKPNHKIPTDITILTHGITNEMVENAPSIEEVKEDFLSFIEDFSIIAHNSSFEEKFIKTKISNSIGNKFLDSIDFLALFFPNLNSIKLDTIIRELKIRDGEVHRALEDSEDLLKVLKFVIDNINKDTRYYSVARRILDYFSEEEWGWARIVSDNIKVVPDSKKVSKENKLKSQKLDIFDYKISYENIINLMSQHFNDTKNGLEDREEQKEYIKHIVDSFNKNESIIIEAGTGIGKTLGYLLPASVYSLETGKTVIVSTKTKALQEQIMEKDLSKVHMVLSKKLKVVKTQGRQNYICVKKIDRFLSDINMFDDFEFKYTKLFYYSLYKILDVADLMLIPGAIERKYSYISSIKSTICSVPSNCLQSRCSHYNDCHYFKMVKEARNANLIIANHSLIMNWPQHLPKGERIIFDEAHSLEKEATETTNLTLSLDSIKNLVFNLDDDKGVLRHKNLNKENLKNIKEICKDIISLALANSQCFEELFDFYVSLSKKRVDKTYSTDAILFSKNYPQGEYGVFKFWDKCNDNFILLSDHYNKLITLLKILEISDEELKIILGNIIEKTEEELKLMKQVINYYENPNSSGYVFWARFSWQKSSWEITRSFTDVGSFLSSTIYPKYESIVFTSATLKEDYNLLIKEIGYDKVKNKYSDEIVCIGSPFDYKNNSRMFFLVPGINLFKDDQKSLIEYIVNISSLLNGRTLCLFTSIKRMLSVYSKVADILYPKGFNLYHQKMSLDVVKDFKQDKKAILFGVETFAEGLDIEGDNLVCVIMERMPDINSIREPIYREKHATYGTDYIISQRILKFRQWAGRLIRSKKDKGAIFVLDNWFSRQNQDVKNKVIKSIVPMPVEIINDKDTLLKAKNSFSALNLIN